MNGVTGGDEERVVLEIRAEWGWFGMAFVVPMAIGVVSFPVVVFVHHEYWGALFLSLVSSVLVVEFVRARVVVTEDEVILVRALWSRRVPRSRVGWLSRTEVYRARLHLEGERGFGIMLPIGGRETIEELAEVLGVPVEERDS